MPGVASWGARGLAGLLVGLALAWGAASNAGTASASGETVTTELVPGWNLAGWMGEEAGVDDLFEEIPALEVVHAWDAGEQAFLWAVRDTGAPYRTLETLTPGMGLWLYLGGTEPFAWTRSLAPESRAVSLRAGFNLVAWAGPHDLTVEQVLRQLGDTPLPAWVWNWGAQRVDDASLLSVGALPRGSALWLHLPRDRQWTQADVPYRTEFVGEFPLARRFELMGRIDGVMAFFVQRFGVSVSGFKVVFGDTSSDVFCGGYAARHIFLQEPCFGAEPHEYSHVVQEYLGTLQPDGTWGHIPEGYRIGPAWLSEAVANIASAVYWDLAGVDSLDEHRRNSELAGVTNPNALEDIQYDMFIGDGGANYRLASLAAHWLVNNVGEQALYEFYRVRPSSVSWEEAFLQAFGMPIEVFYEEFEAYRDELAEPFPQVEGRVVGPDGEGVEDIRIEVIPAGAGEQLNVKTDEAGRFSGRTLQGTYEVSIFWSDSPCHIGWYGGPDGHTIDPTQINRLEFAESDGTGIVIRLPGPGPDLCRTISGVVVDTSGEPVAGLWVSASAQHKQVGYSGQDTTQEGAFSLLVRAGGTYEIHMSTGIAESCTVASDDAEGPRAQVSVGEADVTGVRVTVVRQPRGEPMWVACTAAP